MTIRCLEYYKTHILLSVVIACACYYTYELFPLIFASIFFSYLLNPIVSLLEKPLRSRALASTFVVLTFIMIFIVLGVLVAPFIKQHLFYLINRTPYLVDHLFSTIGPMIQSLSEKIGTPSAYEVKNQIFTHFSDIVQVTVRVMGNILTQSTLLVNVIYYFILLPLMVFYLVNDWQLFLNGIEKLIPIPYKISTIQTFKDIHLAISTYFRGQLFVASILAFLYSTLLVGLGLGWQGFFVGTLTGYLSFIPYVGMLIGYILAISVIFLQNIGWGMVGYVSVGYILIASFDGYYLTPKLIGGKLGIHPLWILIGLLIVGNIFGFFGLLFVLPALAVSSVLIKKGIHAYQMSLFYQGDKRIQ